MAEQETTTSDPDTYDAPTSEPAGCLHRRSMLKGLAIAGVAVPFLAACGSKGGSGAQSTPTTTAKTPVRSPVSTGGSAADVLTPISAVKVGGGVIVGSKGVVVTQPTQGTFEGFSSTCTHMGCTVGTIAGGKIICPCHGSMYSITTGAVVGGPAPRALPKVAVKVDGTNIVKA